MGTKLAIFIAIGLIIGAIGGYLLARPSLEARDVGRPLTILTPDEVVTEASTGVSLLPPHFRDRIRKWDDGQYEKWDVWHKNMFYDCLRKELRKNSQRDPRWDRLRHNDEILRYCVKKTLEKWYDFPLLPVVL